MKPRFSVVTTNANGGTQRSSVNLCDSLREGCSDQDGTIARFNIDEVEIADRICALLNAEEVARKAI